MAEFLVRYLPYALAEFLESEHQNKSSLERLRQSLNKLAEFIERNQIAHGDIQPENLMVSANGAEIQLIDYDGMFVDAFRGAKATELGQVNFQHPQRSGDHFNQYLDRFSFITLDIAIQALIASPALWNISRSEPSAVVFRRNDFIDPGTSLVFQEVMKLPGLRIHAENLAKVAAGGFNSIPSLGDFLQGKGISSTTINFERRATPSVAHYQGAYVVCDAANYAQVLDQVGNRIELIGKVHSIKHGWGLNRKPYVFINFSDWRGLAVKLAIWSDGLKSIEPNVPNDAWVGKWLSITGLIDPPYSSQARSVTYTHLSLTINAKGQIQQIPENEARYRLGAAGPKREVPITANRNSEILQNMGGATRSTAINTPKNTSQHSPMQFPNKSANQQLLDKMRTQTPVSSPQSANSSSSNLPQKPKYSSHSNRQSSGPKSTSWVTWIIFGIIGIALLRACAK